MRSAVGAVVAMGVMFASLAAARPRGTVTVAIDPERRTASGRVALEIENVSGAPLDALELWRFPARLAHLPRGLDDHNFYWVFPRVFSPGAMAIDRVTVDGRAVTAAIVDSEPAGRGTLYRLPLAAPLPPGAHARVEADFRTSLPERYGAFGCWKGACTLAGGFYPMPVELGAGGYDRSAPPARSDLEVTVEAPGTAQALIDGRLARSAHLEDAAGPLIRVGDPLHQRIIHHRGIAITYWSHGRRAQPPDPPGKAAGYLGEDLAALVLHEAAEALDLLAELGLPLPETGRIDLVEAPLRLELAEPHDDAVLVSDQIFRILPAERFRKFHAFQLVRAIFAQVAARRLASRERADDLAWSPDVAASWLVDLFTVRAYRRAEFAKDVLKWVSFIPTIDRILYAPQVPFASAYFNTLDDPDPTRDHLARFSNLRPRGHTIYEKLRDRLGDPDAAAAAEQVWRGVPVRVAAEERAGASLDPFFSQWLGPYPSVDYRFQLLATERTARGYRNRIRLYKVGRNPPVEKVELRVTEWGGARHEAAWDGAGRETVLTVETERAIRAIELDPRGRLTESLPDSNDDLKLDDRAPAPVKFIYNNFGGLLNLQNFSLDLSLDFTLARILDIKNAVRFVVYRSQTAQVGLSASYARAWGRKITPSRLSSGASVSVNAARLEPNFGRVGDTPLPGTRVNVGVGVGYDDRFFIWEPWRATSAGASLSYTLTVQDSGRVLQQVSVGATLERIVPIAVGHGFAWELGAAATFGDLGVPSQMLSAGSPVWLRGYEPDELLGRLRATAKVEYRHTFVHDLDVNLFHVLYLRGIGGALFSEAAAISPCESYSIGAHDLFGDVGYSLRFFEDWFGVSQTVFNVDVAVPLVRRTRGCFQGPGSIPVDASKRAPVGVFIYYGPVW